MSFLMSSTITMRSDFRSESYFSSVIVYPGLAMMVELGSDDAMFLWFLLLMFLCLPPAIWLSLMLPTLAICDWSLFLL